jgi:hypothetical protein
VVRAHGILTAVPAAGATDHICWVHDGDRVSDAVFDDAVRTFLARGLARGDRLLCVGERVIDSVRADVAPFAGVDDLLSAGTLEMLTVADAYAATGEFSADGQLAFYDAATRRAVAEGHTGLRVVADVSALAADALRRPELVRWEHLADRYVVQGPGMTAMCTYRGDLPADALADVASVHPTVHSPDGVPRFRVFFDGDRVVIAGCVDTFDAGRLAQILDASPTVPPTVVDLAPLDFVDVAGCRVIARWAGALRGRGVPVEIRGASRMFQRVWRILALSEVAPVDFTDVAA